MNFTKEFNDAFTLGMKSEIGPWFDPTDPATIEGKYDTKENRKKCGYVNHKNDKGGETKFGIAQNSHMDIKVADLTLEKAKEIYFKEYWLMNHCDKLPHPLSELHFDAAINHGSSRATKLLQKAVGVDDDGSFGPMTMRAVNSSTDLKRDCEDYLNFREDFFQVIAKKPGQSDFLEGWLNRVSFLRNWLKTQ